ncbi:uncharacterized protein HD556DRAFT_1306879 [Suillus plorans]|uniref:CxC2-like cysteine cluster KDZ transposase-associated domain-containing protein n=1 Tax=Suillus plorans TaxID=116603 RepID=A0A9P7ATV0_9AGAM|nr:uncharacterized protein HD556DRAFT_1306879 [Suillus plorans]KAG1796689.1 hypothetical protein HD556DRAFT_1306879 [Suillus plorans]
MPSKYKSEQQRLEARRQSKQRYYERHKLDEHLKSCGRWCKGLGATKGIGQVLPNMQSLRMLVEAQELLSEARELLASSLQVDGACTEYLLTSSAAAVDAVELHCDALEEGLTLMDDTIYAPCRHQSRRISTETEFFHVSESTVAHTSHALPLASETLMGEFNFDFDSCTPDGDFNDPAYENHLAETTLVPKKCDRAMAQWVKEQEKYLMEVIRLEGRGDYTSHEACHGHCECTFEPEDHCKDCFGTELYCKDCTVERHHDNLLHRIELGHAVGERCFNQSRAFDDDFVILDIDRVHEVALDFCGCSYAQSHTTQILRARLYPATCSEPKSAATFRLLQHFQILTFESKASAFEYWQTLVRLTDNTGIKPCKDCYESLLRMIKQWRNITLLKCFGRGHDPAGVDTTEPGACTVLCPACPHPGKNLPKDWKMVSPDKQWLYAQYFAIDANFRLVRKNVSSDSVDPGLSKGWAYFVEETSFKLFLKDVGKVSQKKSTCISHNAVNLAETKSSQGLAATGAGTVDCSRHNFKRPCGVGDLQ